MKRIAFFGPLPPAASGISDYDEELLTLLRKHYEIDVYVAQQHSTAGVPPAVQPGRPRYNEGELPARQYEVFHHGEFYFRQKERPYDLNLYQIGNSIFHEYIHGYLYEYPGAVVFHDYCLHQSRATMLLRRGMLNEYVEEAKLAHPEEGAKVGRSVISGAANDLLLYYFPFVRPILLSTLAAAAHTDVVAQKLRITETPVIKIPMAVISDSYAFDRDPFPGKFVIASLGLATKAKRVIEVLPAIAALRQDHPEILYVIVGEVASHLRLNYEIERWGLQESVVVTGRVQKENFLRWMNRADVIINLRYPSAGEMSATLLRAFTYGKPVVITRLEYNQEIPEDVALRVRPSKEAEDIYRNLKMLISDETLRKKLGAAARHYIENSHRPDQMVEKYSELIELAFKRRETFRKPALPVHLRNGKEIMRNYVCSKCLTKNTADILEWIL